ncbi:hypothetical protein [Roseateles sp.]|uniref:hypothetical protein n=1 Tax=Roseateles sp. TaxID=1971397 RepID=UPI00394568DB
MSLRHSAGVQVLQAAWGGLRRQAFLAGSLALHALLVAGAWQLNVQAAAKAERAQAAAADARMREARTAQIQRDEAQLEQLRRQLGTSAPEAAANPASSPLARAEALTKALEETERQARIKDLARLLKISREAATAQVRLEDFKRMKPPPADAAQALAQLAQRARDAAESRQAREQRQRDGVPLAGSQAGPLGQRGSSASYQGRPDGGWWVTDPDGHTTSTADLRRSFDAFAAPPVLDTADLHLAAEARRFGPGAPFANRVYLDRWNVIGPFPGPDARAINTVYPPEVVVDLDGVYPGKRGLVRWTPQHSSSYPFLPEPLAYDAIYYAATELHLDRDMDVWLDIGADDDTKLWVNDELVWFSAIDKPWYHQWYLNMHTERANYAMVEGRVRVSLRAGRNRLLLKLYNVQSATFFGVVLAP